MLDAVNASPGPGQITVAIRAAALNPIDYKLFSGFMGNDPANLPLPLGSEAAGVVTAVDSEATGPAGPVTVGDEVIISGVSGAYADELTVPAARAIPKPAELDFAQASGLLLTGGTAWHALAVAGVKAGDTLLLHAAGGGVGLMVVQLARARGVRVIGTASAGRHEQLRSLGAEPIEYGPGLTDRVRSLAPDGIDAVIDAVGDDEAVDVSLELVPDRDRIVTLAAFGRAAEAGIKLLGGGPGADPGTDIREASRLELVKLVRAGQLTVTVARTYPLSEAAAALTELSFGHSAGKIALIP
ncbi:MAG: NADP-dependent oxidoreductase [Frankiales bacterium]|nr:NADP-dependent oxidoreductase [Frankiales bacterium]